MSINATFVQILSTKRNDPMTAQIFDTRNCLLGEGPLWHPVREQLFWFDILQNRLLSQKEGENLEWQFDERVSAAGWVDENTMLIASETSLSSFDLSTGATKVLTLLEADNPASRSNDGRADPWGGFWIGTMGKNAEPGMGAIYRYYRGELRCLVPNVSISNSICFAPDKTCAYYTDTVTGKVMRVTLGKDGWPVGDANVFLDLTEEGLNPDGAVVDANGHVWIAQWGASRVAGYSPQGTFIQAFEFPASQMTCPSFGGADLSILYATSAAEGVSEVSGGQVFYYETQLRGQAEHQVILPE